MAPCLKKNACSITAYFDNDALPWTCNFSPGKALRRGNCNANNLRMGRSCDAVKRVGEVVFVCVKDDKQQ